MFENAFESSASRLTKTVSEPTSVTIAATTMIVHTQKRCFFTFVTGTAAAIGPRDTNAFPL